MSQLDAKFKSEIFRKDNPLILAARRDKAVIGSARVLYAAAGYMPGQCLARDPADGLYKKWSALSGGSYDSPVVLFDQLTQSDELAVGDGTSSVSGAALARVLYSGVVYTSNLIEYDSNFKSAIKSVDRIDANSVAMTSF